MNDMHAIKTFDNYTVDIYTSRQISKKYKEK